MVFLCSLFGGWLAIGFDFGRFVEGFSWYRNSGLQAELKSVKQELVEVKELLSVIVENIEIAPEANCASDMHAK